MVIGLQFPNTSVSPSLKMGMTLPFFNGPGKYPAAKQSFISGGKIRDKDSVPNLYIFGHTWSGSSYIEDVNQLIILKTSRFVLLIQNDSTGDFSGLKYS